VARRHRLTQFQQLVVVAVEQTTPQVLMAVQVVAVVHHLEQYGWAVLA
jgi:hypothetical protein